MSGQTPSTPKRRLITRVFRTSLLLVVLYVLSSGPASYGVARGWLDESDYPVLYDSLERLLTRSPLHGAYAWYRSGWVEFAGDQDNSPRRYSGAHASRRFRQQDPFGLPSVAPVSVPLDPPAPRLTVVHIADWHFVPFDVFAIDERFHNPEISDTKLEQRYASFLAEVEAVQSEQRIVLEHLVAQRGLEVVFVERLTDDLVDAYKARAKGVAAVQASLLEEAVERAVRDDDVPAVALARLSLEQHQSDSLDTGAAGMLWAEGKLDDVLAAEDAEAHAAANPVQPDGTVQWNNAAQARREQAIALRLLTADESLVTVILGGRHDLSDELATAGDVRFVRVEVQAWQRATVDEP